MPTTTIKVSTTTRDRIRSFGGTTHEETIVAALDALEAEQFWTQAERAADRLRNDVTTRRAVADEAEAWDAAVGAMQ